MSIFYRNRTLESRNRYKRTHRRCNSADSVVTDATECSHKYYQPKEVKKEDLNKNVSTRSADCLIESTNLSDLPGKCLIFYLRYIIIINFKIKLCTGHKKDFESNDKEPSAKNLSTDSKTDSCKKNLSDIPTKKCSNNDLDQDMEKNTHKNSSTNCCNETDFRLSLGLVRNNDLSFKNLKTPMKRRSVKKNSLSSLKKYNFDTGNSLDVVRKGSIFLHD